ncbi:hypothetical protein [Streptomyces pactum]|uniref:hypothetical protein n=1 Tax=Streptomyces pactum TaxID=68249 RepID=UPI0036F8F04F
MRSENTPFIGGPMDGKVLPVLVGPTGQPPKTYEIPVPDEHGGRPVVHVYRRVAATTGRLGLVSGWRYEYEPGGRPWRLKWPWSKPEPAAGAHPGAAGPGAGPQPGSGPGPDADPGTGTTPDSRPGTDPAGDDPPGATGTGTGDPTGTSGPRPADGPGDERAPRH